MGGAGSFLGMTVFILLSLACQRSAENRKLCDTCEKVALRRWNRQKGKQFYLVGGNSIRFREMKHG